ncbi:hypothetical protein I862_03910 [endosymbiont of Acanthamoeba sp. UWC8]|uniref:hypothetical protein n=1 Tax=endosymbiont of Acanthamoeba sp. UWC8 TaxID=86106 RepID=UPI0004D13EEE|nr:hypothetical protein [endosymbiont of Acanthamoeba sp. UWC8]AIF81342.1 hypothetical protein I862_03910 [endosymbiont of Acanthamoeba sp. UWC8]
MFLMRYVVLFILTFSLVGCSGGKASNKDLKDEEHFNLDNEILKSLPDEELIILHKAVMSYSLIKNSKSATNEEKLVAKEKFNSLMVKMTNFVVEHDLKPIYFSEEEKRAALIDFRFVLMQTENELRRKPPLEEVVRRVYALQPERAIRILRLAAQRYPKIS